MALKTIKTTDLVNKTAVKVRMPEMLVHLRLQEAAQRLGIPWGATLLEVTGNVIVEEATERCNWKK